MSEFTPGPWTVGDYGIEGNPDKHGYSTTVLRAVDGHVYDEYDSDSATIDIANNADALLIAAAPDLYAALEALFRDYKQLADSGDAGNWSLEEQDVGKQALAALNKARNGA